MSDENVTVTNMGWTRASTASAPAPNVSLTSGTVLAARYEIVKLLGQGGMGAVYKARDVELDRAVAVKVIRGELANDPKTLARFKQELILARQVTHKNVIRIFDLGTDQGIRFITMEYVEGRDLSALLEKQKFSPDQAARLVRQVCLALEAAHAEKVIHRDLKPQNVMVDENGSVRVMDFGLARSVELTGLTQTGAILGTPAYMSPEQAKGIPADERSDLFSLGIIFYELLTGQVPFQADTAWGTLVKRTQTPASPAVSIDPSVPQPLSDIAARCLAIDPAQRYQTASEVVADLDAWLGSTPSLSKVMVRPPSIVTPRLPLMADSSARRWIALSVGVVLLLLAGFFAWEKFSPVASGPHRPVTLLVADFQNTTGDPVFDGTLESVTNIAMEGASFVNAFDRGRARRVAAGLQPNLTRLDESLARLVALRQGVNVIVDGSIARRDEGYRITMRAVDAVTGKLIASREDKASNKESVLTEVGRLAAGIRKGLGDTTPEAVQLQAAESFTSSSLQAVHVYATGLEYLAAGKRQESIPYFSQAVELDPNFGRGYIGLAVAYTNLKKLPEAGENYKKALALLDRLSERERYRTLGIYYVSYVRNYEQAIEALRKLVYLYPADAAAYNNLSLAYAFTGNIQEALTASRHALEITPGDLQRRDSFSGLSMVAGDFETAAAEAQRILQQNPGFDSAYLVTALSRLAEGNVDAARAAYSRLEKANPQGYSIAKTGLADLEMYLGAYGPALASLQDGIAADQRDHNDGELALKYVARAEALLATGKRAQAIEAASQGAQLSGLEYVLFLAGHVLGQAGDEAKAKQVEARLDALLQPQTRAYARMIEGDVAVARNQPQQAVDAFQDAQKLQNSWMSHFLLGKAYVAAGHFPEALNEFEICQKRRAEVTDLFLSNTATLRHLPPLYYWLGRAQEGMGTTQAARTSYQEFLKLRPQPDPADQLATDARRRLGG